ncbi:MAG: class I SAM-dependent methyltransferase [Alphaproteobacteria bacterium]|nr:class I SAM-dependent methyltransferase [Alphaproteobacteria bacterium]
MTPEVTRLIDFYRTPLGRIARGLVREPVLSLTGDVTGKRVLGLGFASPYLRALLEPSERMVVLMPARQGASAWPREGPNCTLMADPLEMPFTDSSFDVIIAVHALEHAADAEEQMRELWRIAAPNARLVVVVPRRRGPWANRDNTPFGSGNPFSRRQLDQLLRAHSFVPEVWRHALYVPPFDWSPIVRSARLFEKGGRLFGGAIAGVIVTVARKQQFPAIARRKRAERLVRVPALAPQTAMHLPRTDGR